MNTGAKIFYGVFCLAIAAALWTGFYGLALGWFYGDWQVLETTITTNPLLPAQQLWVYGDNSTLQLVAAGAAVPALIVALIVAIVGLRTSGSPLGDAAFQTTPQLRQGGWFKKRGHIFGRLGRNLLRAKDDRHHLVIGPTRSGKGAGYVIPNALMHKGSMLVTDLKGEVYTATAGYRQKEGNQVFLFAPGDKRTHRYNPLDFIRQERGTRTTDIQNIASILVPENSGSENSVWQGLAQQVIAGAISYVLESPYYEGRRHFGEINSLFNSGENLQELIATIKKREPGLSRFTVESFNTYLALSDRAAASALLDIQKALRPFKNERIVAATSVTDMNLKGMKHRPVSVYLAPNITNVTLVKPLLTLFVQQLMDLLTLEHDPKALPVYFLLDEFRQLKRVDEIMTKLPYVAGYNIKLAFIVQDLKNLDEIYGETSRHSLLGNCGYQLVLGANDQATAEYVSRALGKKTIRYETESRTIELMGLHRRTRVGQVRERELMMPQEVRQMPEEKMVLLVEGQRPVFGNKLRFFKTQPFKAAEAYSQAHRPEVPTVDYLPVLPVPATTNAYLSGVDDKPPEPPSDTVLPIPRAEDTATVPETPTAAEDAPVELPAEIPPQRIVRQSVPLKRAPAGSLTLPKQTRPRLDLDAMIEAAAAKLKPAEEKLRAAIEDHQASDPSPTPRKRKSYLDILSATVPDPLPDAAQSGE
jgi:type IV secretion system protein VirD4